MGRWLTPLIRAPNFVWVRGARLPPAGLELVEIDQVEQNYQYIAAAGYTFDGDFLPELNSDLGED